LCVSRATRIPKISGTSLNGAARTYAAYQYRSLDCAGQKDHCGQPICPICYTFGSLNIIEEGGEKKTIAHSGVINLSDAHVLLFPVHSMAGPVWVSTPQRLREAGFTVNDVPSDWKREQALFTWERDDDLNLGWLMVEKGAQVTVQAPEKWHEAYRWQAVKECIVLVQENLFGQVVNSNLEVRTSVSIDPKRGAAEEGALFTYEAIPRATFLVSEVVLDDYREGQQDGLFPVSKTKGNNDERDDLPGGPWKNALDVVRAGLRMAEWLGVGGMGTRGFGRITIVSEMDEEEWK